LSSKFLVNTVEGGDVGGDETGGTFDDESDSEDLDMVGAGDDDGLDKDFISD
jgi:hypothetical protein